jgi:FKBP-type peptidyl-prolyl cis-trans isomerase SlyD
MSESIRNSKFVALTYTITDDTDETLERIDVPITYIQGRDSNVIEKIEKALEGHQEGDDVTVEISPEEGFGPHQSELTFTDDLENVPPEFHKIGAEVEFQNNQNEVKKFLVTKIENGKLTVDGNHPFAGKTIKYNIKVREVRDATAEELANGVEQMPQLH